MSRAGTIAPKKHFTSTRPSGGCLRNELLCDCRGSPKLPYTGNHVSLCSDSHILVCIVGVGRNPSVSLLLPAAALGTGEKAPYFGASWSAV